VLFLSACDSRSQPVSTAQQNVSILPALEMRALKRQRTVRIYLPASYALPTNNGETAKRYPVLYMHDGQNLFDDATSYVGEWGVDETLNALAQSHGLELIVVGVDHGGEKRMPELNPFDSAEFGNGEGDAYLDFLVGELKPLIDQNYRTLPERANTAIMGSSMGGLISHYALARHPQIFSRAGIFSPAYWAGPQIFPMAEQQPLPPDARLYLLMGGQEGEGMVKGLDAMRATLAAQHPAENWQAKLVPEGIHNEGFWRAEFAEAVLWLFSQQPINQNN
jgi:predicted alpha/beta superfamily hydrolase